MKCRTFTLAHANHPIFTTGKGAAATPLNDQAFTLFCAVRGYTQSLVRLLTGKNHKMIEGIYRRNGQCRAQHVECRELEIKYGGKWQDVEADEVDVGGNFAQMVRERGDGEPEGKVKWEQWGGLVQRGEPGSLLLTRLNPVHTHPRAPGPGPVKLTDWGPLARKHLAGKKVILHTDGAQTYNLKIPGMLHDHVTHKKKQLFKDGKPVENGSRSVWVMPKYVKAFGHKIPGAKRTVQCKGGTQIADRFWRHLRSFLKNRPKKVGSAEVRMRVRSSQWSYWYRESDLWEKTGEMITKIQKWNIESY